MGTLNDEGTAVVVCVCWRRRGRKQKDGEPSRKEGGGGGLNSNEEDGQEVDREHIHTPEAHTLTDTSFSVSTYI